MAYKNNNSNDYGIIITNIKREILPANNHAFIDVPGLPGEYLQPKSPKSRRIVVEFKINGLTFAELQTRCENIAAWLYSDDWGELSFSDQPDKTYFAVITSAIDAEQIATLETATVEFIAKPYSFEGEENQSFVDDAATVVNTGTVAAFPKFLITFLASASYLTITKGTEFIKVTHDFVLNDTLEIDLATDKILHNGARAMNLLDWSNYPGRDDFNLVVGSNDFSITPVDVCSATVYWKPIHRY